MPDWREEVSRRLRGSALRAAQADIVEELSQHLDDRYAELRARGMSDDEAVAAALAELDVDDALGERIVASARAEAPPPLPLGARLGNGLFGGLGGDLRFAVRMLARAPGLTIVATLVIALGIGANTAIFSVVNSLLLRPLPGVAAPDELVAVYTSDFSGPLYGASSYPDIEAMRESGAFAGVAAYSPRPFSVVYGDRAERVIGEVASADFFEVLGVQPAVGRLFSGSEAGGPGTSNAVVLSHDTWQTQFGGAADVVGRTLRVNGQPLNIIGVAQPDFRGGMRGVRMAMWLPLSAPEGLVSFDVTNRGNRGFFTFARLADATTADAARSRLDAVASALHAEYPDAWTDVNNRSRVLTVLPESEVRVPRQARAAVFGMLGLLGAVVMIVLLIACTNVANLMLARASARQSEMGVRLALGATRGRIVRQLLAESLLLAGLGGVTGVLLAVWLIRALDSVSLPGIGAMAFDVALDVRVVVFAVIVTVLTGIIFGLVPALNASRAPAPLLRSPGSGRGRRMRARNALVIVQVAASMVLLAGAGLFLRSLMEAREIDTGMATENMLLVPFDLSLEGYTYDAAQRFYEDIQERVRALPGVQAVTVAEAVPLSLGWARRGITVEGYTPQDGEDMEYGFNGVGAGYFETLGIPLLQGRGFTPADREGAPGVMVVNEAFARRFWPNGGAMGGRVSFSGSEGPFHEVVGIVPDGKYRSLTEDPMPYFYYPYLQRPSRTITLHVRTAIDPAQVAPAIRREVRALASAIPMPQITTLREHVGMVMTPQRIAGIVLGVLGGLAILTAIIGLYGVIAYTVAQRTREFGIRTALGAVPADVQQMVIGQGLRLALTGGAIGIVLALGLFQLIRSMLLVSPWDPGAFVGVVLLLMLAAGVASWVPARRATRADPLTALRAE